MVRSGSDALLIACLLFLPLLMGCPDEPAPKEPAIPAGTVTEASNDTTPEAPNDTTPEVPNEPAPEPAADEGAAGSADEVEQSAVDAGEAKIDEAGAEATSNAVDSCKGQVRDDTELVKTEVTSKTASSTFQVCAGGNLTSRGPGAEIFAEAGSTVTVAGVDAIVYALKGSKVIVTAQNALVASESGAEVIDETVAQEPDPEGVPVVMTPKVIKCKAVTIDRALAPAGC